MLPGRLASHGFAVLRSSFSSPCPPFWSRTKRPPNRTQISNQSRSGFSLIGTLHLDIESKITDFRILSFKPISQ